MGRFDPAVQVTLIDDIIITGRDRAFCLQVLNSFVQQGLYFSVYGFLRIVGWAEVGPALKGLRVGNIAPKGSRSAQIERH